MLAYRNFTYHMTVINRKSITKNINKILNASNEGFWLVDNNEITIDVNPKMCSILGRAKRDIIGRSIFDFVDETNKKVFIAQGKLPGLWGIKVHMKLH